MKNQPNETNETMSTGELLGKLKQNFANADSAAPSNRQPESVPTNEDDLDIAALLKQYLPGNRVDEPEADFVLDAVADAGDDTPPAPAPDADCAPNQALLDFITADDIPEPEIAPVADALGFDADALVGDDLDAPDDVLPTEEELLAAAAEFEAASDDEPAEETPHSLLLDALGLDDDEDEDPLAALNPTESAPVYEELVVDAPPVAAPITVDDAVPVTTSGVRKYVYHFRPSARSLNHTQTVKVQETIPQPAPVAEPHKPETDTYFAGRSTKPDFSFDDEPVLPDASAFDDLIPPIGVPEPEPAAPAAAIDETPEYETIEIEDTAAPVEPAVQDEAEPSEPDLDDTDINLMIALGYEDELSKTVGIDRVNEIEKQLDYEVGDDDVNESAAFRGFEYTEKKQTKEITQSYKAEYSGIVTRLLGTLILTVALFLYENVSLFGVSLPGALNMQQYPVVHTLVSLQLLVLAAALSWRQLYDGIKGAVTLKPSPQSLPAVAVAVALLYDIILAFLAPQGGVSLYNFPAALCLCLLVLCDMMNLRREIYSFSILADRGEKFAVRAKYASTSLPEEEALVLDIRRASFINNYFTRTNRKASTNTLLNYVLLPVVALAIALAIVSFSSEKSLPGALNIFALTVQFCMPVSTLIATTYPLFRASRLAYEQDTAIVGEASAEEYSNADVVSFADKDVFPSYQVKLRSIKLYGNARPDLVLFAAASVFSQVGGPLHDVLELATKEFDRAEQIELTGITESGIEAVVDGVKVLVGRPEFLEAYNIYPLHDAEDDANTAGGARILYIVMDGQLSAKLYVQYDIDADFAFTLRELAREHISARIRTYDPNIDDELIAANLRGKQYDVHVEKQLQAPTEADPLPEMDSGLVSRASAKSLVHTAAMCSRLTHVESTGNIIRTIALVISLLIMLFLTLLSSSVEISSIYVALYQLFWMIPSLIVTRLSLK